MDDAAKRRISKAMKKSWREKKRLQRESSALIPLAAVKDPDAPKQYGRSRPRADGPTPREQVAMKLLLTIDTILKGHDK